jgi:hypothetical protein
VQLASAVVNFPAVYAGNPPDFHAVDSAKTSMGIPLLRLEDAEILCNLLRRQLICLKFMLETLLVFTPVDPAKTSVSIPLLRLEQVKLWLHGQTSKIL